MTQIITAVQGRDIVITPTVSTATRGVLLASPHQAFSQGVRLLLATVFEAVVMVADEVSLVESAGCLCNDVVVIDLALVRGDAVELVRRVRGCVPDARIVVLSADGQSSVVQSVADAGADAFIVKPAIAGDLLVAIDAVLSGRKYVSRTANIR